MVQRSEIDTIKYHTEDRLGKATSFLFLSEMIAKLERTLRTTVQNKDQTQTPTPNESNTPYIHLIEVNNCIAI